jgi:regulator of protease activity HflC (stomatin/prohibitin superfamily)
MKRKMTIKAILCGVACVMTLSSCWERIDAGCEGIKVNLYGDERGVGQVSIVTGRVFYNPFTTQIYEYPTFAQTIDYEPFEVNSKDGSKFKVDPSMIVKVKDGKSPFIFKKYRKELSDVIKGSLYIYVKDAARIEFNKYTADMIVSNREAVDKSFENRVRQAFEKEGFELEQLTPGIAYPSSYEEAINAKNKAIQDQMRVENEVKVAEANAKKILVAAQAEAEANRLKQQALTPQILQKMWIEKWNGTLPTVITSGNSSTFLDISKLK